MAEQSRAEFYNLEAIVYLALVAPFLTTAERQRLAWVAEVLEQVEHRLSAEHWARFLWKVHPEKYYSEPPRSLSPRQRRQRLKGAVRRSA